MGCVAGIDPGMRHTGIAVVSGGRCVDHVTLHGADTPAAFGATGGRARRRSTFAVRQDFGLGVCVAQDLAAAALAFLATHPEITDLAVETYVHQGPERRGPWSWQGAVVAAVMASAAPTGVVVHWQDADTVLTGWGAYRELLMRQPVTALGTDGALDEHATSALLHALHLESDLRPARRRLRGVAG